MPPVPNGAAEGASDERIARIERAIEQQQRMLFELLQAQREGMPPAATGPGRPH
jgi:hypothetical protein